MELNFVSFEGSVVSNSEFWGVNGFVMVWATYLLRFTVVFLFVEGLQWGVLHWSLMALGWPSVEGCCLFGRFSSINVPHQDFYGASKFWS